MSVTRVFKITSNPAIMARIERFLALLHYNSRFGHSGIFAMALDGDGGGEKITVEDIDAKLSKEVDLIGSVGYDVETARDKSYGGKFIDRNRLSAWETRSPGELYRNGELVG